MVPDLWGWITRFGQPLGTVATLITIFTPILAVLAWAWRMWRRTRLVREHTRPRKEQIAEAIQLERLRFAREQEAILSEAMTKAKRIPLGTHRPMAVTGIAEAALREGVSRRIEIRKEMIQRFPGLGSPESLEGLCNDIETWIDARQMPILADIAYAGGVTAPTLSKSFGETAIVVKAWVRRELQILKTEASINAPTTS